MTTHSGFYTWVVVSVLLALLLCVYPLPAHYAWFRPEFLPLLCIFWALYCPFRFGVVIAWGIGLAQDVVVGGVWGAHAIALAFITYVCLLSYQRLRSYSLAQQILWVFILVGIHQIFVNWVYGLDGYDAPVEMIILPTLITALCWPLVLTLLKPSRGVWHV
ncbi:rod shape-determining protein MreD [Marinagarivorans algicola]|uniref:rod shape-determining protein MreD n=1 Tax=Marinagarivorans algicola TaxID=1513270 RepID=UPI0006B584EC|nr:rod shape-determining protein MreD [Marinagarivorans algicola]